MCDLNQNILDLFLTELKESTDFLRHARNGGISEMPNFYIHLDCNQLSLFSQNNS